MSDELKSFLRKRKLAWINDMAVCSFREFHFREALTAMIELFDPGKEICPAKYLKMLQAYKKTQDRFIIPENQRQTIESVNHTLEQLLSQAAEGNCQELISSLDNEDTNELVSCLANVVTTHNSGCSCNESEQVAGDKSDLWRNRTFMIMDTVSQNLASIKICGVECLSLGQGKNAVDTDENALGEGIQGKLINIVNKRNRLWMEWMTQKFAHEIIFGNELEALLRVVKISSRNESVVEDHPDIVLIQSSTRTQFVLQGRTYEEVLGNINSGLELIISITECWLWGNVKPGSETLKSRLSESLMGIKELLAKQGIQNLQDVKYMDCDMACSLAKSKIEKRLPSLKENLRSIQRLLGAQGIQELLDIKAIQELLINLGMDYNINCSCAELDPKARLSLLKMI